MINRSRQTGSTRPVDLVKDPELFVELAAKQNTPVNGRVLLGVMDRVKDGVVTSRQETYLHRNGRVTMRRVVVRGTRGPERDLF